jgi:hypothetical protein
MAWQVGSGERAYPATFDLAHPCQRYAIRREPDFEAAKFLKPARATASIFRTSRRLCGLRERRLERNGRDALDAANATTSE